MENVELDHNDIRSDIFRMQMEKWGQKTLSPAVPEIKVIKEKKRKIKKQKVHRISKRRRKIIAAKKESRNRVIIQGGDFE